MTSKSDLTRSTPALYQAERTLVETLTGQVIDLAEDATAKTWLESLVDRLPLQHTLPIVEHFFGALPLVRAHFAWDGEHAEAFQPFETGQRLASLGLFTPNPEFDLRSAAVTGEFNHGKMRLRGKIRIPTSAAAGSLVLVSLADEQEHRLAWLDHQIPDLFLKPADGDSSTVGGPCWLKLEDVEVDVESISEPIQLDLASLYSRHLEAYARAYALVAACYAKRGIRALRRAARTTTHGTTPFNKAQILTMDLTGIEIESDLVNAAAHDSFNGENPDTAPAGETSERELSGHSGLQMAAAASKVLSKVVAKTAELIDTVGFSPEGPFQGDRAELRAVNAFLGGPLMVESELAYRLGI